MKPDATPTPGTEVEAVIRFLVTWVLTAVGLVAGAAAIIVPLVLFGAPAPP
jgi:hypothetical protein